MNNITKDRLEIPRDRATINAWCRAAYVLSPTVNKEIDFYTSKIIGKLKKHKKIPLHTLELIVNQVLVLGECFILKDDYLRVLNPDYVNAKADINNPNKPIYSLRPDENLRRAIKDNKFEYVDGYSKESYDILVSSINNGENIPLENYDLFHICKKNFPYELRGTSILAPWLKTMIDKQDFSILFGRLEELKEEKTKDITINNKLYTVDINNTIIKDVFNMNCKVYASLIQEWINHYNGQ